ncbi:hypothetical protein IE53DRAFT_385393 [Violaceomyces palustris]|uniref:Uncharacterized protein n=1 Tax=Violaceomyces palustris TaxID=1673888 RepID=A0ACD0P2G3_9BASI|nr:hypothetical protein IE53DRAFT_385393 [Violaceomyces palustris]
MRILQTLPLVSSLIAASLCVKHHYVDLPDQPGHYLHSFPLLDDENAYSLLVRTHRDSRPTKDHSLTLLKHASHMRSFDEEQAKALNLVPEDHEGVFHLMPLHYSRNRSESKLVTTWLGKEDVTVDLHVDENLAGFQPLDDELSVEMIRYPLFHDLDLRRERLVYFEFDRWNKRIVCTGDEASLARSRGSKWWGGAR